MRLSFYLFMLTKVCNWVCLWEGTAFGSIVEVHTGVFCTVLLFTACHVFYCLSLFVWTLLEWDGRDNPLSKFIEKKKKVAGFMRCDQKRRVTNELEFNHNSLFVDHHVRSEGLRCTHWKSTLGRTVRKAKSTRIELIHWLWLQWWKVCMN